MTVGFYYWRGRPLPLMLKNGQYSVMVPKTMKAIWHEDKAKGRIKRPS